MHTYKYIDVHSACLGLITFAIAVAIFAAKHRLNVFSPFRSLILCHHYSILYCMNVVSSYDRQRKQKRVTHSLQINIFDIFVSFFFYGSSMKGYECWMWRGSSFVVVVIIFVWIANFSKGRILAFYRHTLVFASNITMKCGYWYPGIFIRTPPELKHSMCVWHVNTHRYTFF